MQKETKTAWIPFFLHDEQTVTLVGLVVEAATDREKGEEFLLQKVGGAPLVSQLQSRKLCLHSPCHTCSLG